MARYRNLVVLMVSILLAGAFVLAGGMKLVGSPDMIASFARWGYDPGFMYVVGMVEVGSALLLLIPGLSFVGAIGIAGIMLGAIWTHLTHGELAFAIVPLVLLSMAAWLGWATRPEGLGGQPRLRRGEFASALPDAHDAAMRDEHDRRRL